MLSFFIFLFKIFYSEKKRKMYCPIDLWSLTGFPFPPPLSLLITYLIASFPWNSGDTGSKESLKEESKSISFSRATWSALWC